jgi:hypothetical protein
MRNSWVSVAAALGLALLVNEASTATQIAQLPAVSAVTPIAPTRTPFPSEAASAHETQFSFFAYGDTREESAGLETQKRHGRVVEEMLARIKAMAESRYPVRFIVQSGDAVTRGGEALRWGSFNALIERLTLQGGVSYFFAVGNHDVTGRPLGDPAREEGLQNTLAAMSKLMPQEGSPRRLHGYPTYAFGYGNTFVIALDSNIAEDPIQLDWVTRQLEGLDRSRYIHVMAAFHHPPLSSGPHGGDIVEPQTEAIRRLYMPLFRRHHVKMTLAGHDHLLDHWVERYDDAKGSHRMDHVLSGGGGAPTYTFKSDPDLSLYSATAAPQKVRIEHLLTPSRRTEGNPLHFMVIRVDGDKLSLEVVGVDAGPTIYMPYRRPRVELDEKSITSPNQ